MTSARAPESYGRDHWRSRRSGEERRAQETAHVRASLSDRRTRGNVESWPRNGTPAGQGRTGRHQDSPGTEESSHDLFGARIGGGANSHSPAEQPLMTTAGQNQSTRASADHGRRPSGSSSASPAALAPSAHSARAPSSRRRRAGRQRRRRARPSAGGCGRTCGGIDVASAAPRTGPPASNAFARRRRQMFVIVSSRSERATMNGRSPNRLARACRRSAQPVGHVREDVAAVLLRADEHLVAVQTLRC